MFRKVFQDRYVMIFKIPIRIFVFFALPAILNCIRNPSDSNRTTDEDRRIENNYYYLPHFVQDDRGTNFTSYRRYLLYFSDADLADNTPPDTLQVDSDIEEQFIDRNGEVILFSSRKAWRARPSETGYELDSLAPESPIQGIFYPFSTEDRAIWIFTDSGYVVQWDGVSLRTRLQSSLINGRYARGIFAEGPHLHCFQSYNKSAEHIIIDTTTGETTSMTIDSISFTTVFKLDGTFFMIGLPAGRYSSSPLLYELSGDQSPVIRDSVESSFSDCLQTPEAVYGKSGTSIFKVSGQRCYRLYSSYTLSGPLFLDRNSRPAFLYSPTRRIIYLDTLQGFIRTTGW